VTGPGNWRVVCLGVAQLAATVVARFAATAVARAAATVVARLAAAVVAVVPVQRLDLGRWVVAVAVGRCRLPAPVGAPHCPWFREVARVAARSLGYRRLRQPVAGRATHRCWQTAPRPAVAVGIPGSGVVGMAGRLPRPMAVGSMDH
jgi:hypothetical protein